MCLSPALWIKSYGYMNVHTYIHVYMYAHIKQTEISSLNCIHNWTRSISQWSLFPQILQSATTNYSNNVYMLKWQCIFIGCNAHYMHAHNVQCTWVVQAMNGWSTYLWDWRYDDGVRLFSSHIRHCETLTKVTEDLPTICIHLQCSIASQLISHNMHACTCTHILAPYPGSLSPFFIFTHVSKHSVHTHTMYTEQRESLVHTHVSTDDLYQLILHVLHGPYRYKAVSGHGWERERG